MAYLKKTTPPPPIASPHKPSLSPAPPSQPRPLTCQCGSHLVFSDCSRKSTRQVIFNFDLGRNHPIFKFLSLWVVPMTKAMLPTVLFQLCAQILPPLARLRTPTEAIAFVLFQGCECCPHTIIFVRKFLPIQPIGRFTARANVVHGRSPPSKRLAFPSERNRNTSPIPWRCS
jgi:hypothetical protein